MSIFSYHLLRTNPSVTIRAMVHPIWNGNAPGLIHAESSWTMRLGAPIISPDRAQLSNLSMFTAWQQESDLEEFLKDNKLGRKLAQGWHVRMTFLRRWGSVAEFSHLPELQEEIDNESPVVAVTLARMRLTQVPRFIHWGRPVEEQVRDSPGAALALASMRPLNTVSTFTIWETQRAMLDMVGGHSKMLHPDRHANAMKERNRKDFHFEFTTLRFKPLSEHGKWNGRSNYVPGLQKS